MFLSLSLSRKRERHTYTQTELSLSYIKWKSLSTIKKKDLHLSTLFLLLSSICSVFDNEVCDKFREETFSSFHISPIEQAILLLGSSIDVQLLICIRCITRRHKDTAFIELHFIIKIVKIVFFSLKVCKCHRRRNNLKIENFRVLHINYI